MDLSPPFSRRRAASGRAAGPPLRRDGPTDLADLMVRCAEGDEEAFAELYDRTTRRVYGTVVRVLRSPEQAEEVTQEVFVDVWNSASAYRPDRGSVIGWIVTRAHRRAVDRVRSVTREVARDDRYALSETERDIDEVWDSVERQQDVERVRGALANLTPIQQQAVSLAYYGGLTQREISSSLNLPMGTVKTRIRDGLIRLREALGGSEA